MIRRSISLIIREMQIKTTLRNHLTLVRMAIIKKKKNLRTIHGWEGVEQRELSYTVGGNVNWYNTMENSTEVPWESENWITTWFRSPAPGIYLRKIIIQRHRHPTVHQSIIYNSQDMDATSNREMGEEDVIHSQMEYYSAVKRAKSCYPQQHRWIWRLSPWVK